MYQLFYQDLQVGMIDVSDVESPDREGHFQIDRSLNSTPLGVQIQNYISSSIEVNSIDCERHWDFLTSHHNKYIDLLDSEKWFLVDTNGEISWIYPPEFEEDSEISWVYNCPKMFER